MKVFLAGASGALGRPLINQLRDARCEVWGLAHRPDSLETIEKRGAHPVKGDALDRANIFELIEQIRPDVVIDQLTSLPSSPFDLAHRLPADRRLRLEGGGYLFEAAQTFHVQRYVQQLSGFYLDGGDGLATEASPLRTSAPGTIGASARMYAALEKWLALGFGPDGVPGCHAALVEAILAGIPALAGRIRSGQSCTSGSVRDRKEHGRSVSGL